MSAGASPKSIIKIMNEKQEIEINGDILEIIPLGAARDPKIPEP